MSEFEGSRVLAVPPERAFSVLSDAAALPGWLPTVGYVEEPGPDLLRLAGERGGSSYDVTGLWRARPEQRRVEWGSRGTGRYAGWLQVMDHGQGCEVVLHLSFLDEAAREGRAVGADEGIADALAGLARLVGA